MSSVYLVLAALILLALVAAGVLVVSRGRGLQRLTPLGGLALAFVVAGIVFGENRLVGYGLMVVGVVLAVVDIVRKRQRT